MVQEARARIRLHDGKFIEDVIKYHHPRGSSEVRLSVLEPNGDVEVVLDQDDIDMVMPTLVTIEE